MESLESFRSIIEELDDIMNYNKKVTLEFSDLCLKIGGLDALKNVSGVAEPGQILAIMGPSGAGKTLLLNCLAGRQTLLRRGRIMLNGRPINKRLRRKISFVLQDDLFLDNLSLKDTLMFTAHLRLPESMTSREKLAKVNNIIETLDLGKCLDTRVGNTLERGLSGGEKKRANIGCELLTNPAILLLDEPTSGLDSRAASELLDTLKKYAITSGKTVITTIHQPSSHMFHVFDRLLLLSEGEAVYFGDTFKVVDYFSQMGLNCPQHYNPADFIIDKVRGNSEERTKIHQAARKQSWGLPRYSKHRADNGSIEDEIGAGRGTINHAMSISGIIDETYSDSVFMNTSSDSPDQVSPGLDCVGNILGGNSPAVVMNNNPTAAHHRIARHYATGVSNGRLGGDTERHAASRGSEDDDADTEKWPTGFATQLVTLTRRNFKQNRGVVLSKLDFIKQVSMAFVMGALWFQIGHTEESVRNMAGMVYFFASYWGFESMFSVVNTFICEREVIYKERSAGAYRLSAYFLSKIVGVFPLQIVMSMMSVTVSFWMAGLHHSVIPYLCFAGTTVLYTQAGQAIGLLLSALSNSPHEALTYGNIAMLSSMLLAGTLYVTALPPGIRWLRYISFTSYAYAAYLSDIFLVVPLQISCSSESSFPECESTTISSTPTSRPDASPLPAAASSMRSELVAQGFVNGSSIVASLVNFYLPLWAYHAVLVVFALGFYLIAYLVLWFYKRPA